LGITFAFIVFVHWKQAKEDNQHLWLLVNDQTFIRCDNKEKTCELPTIALKDI
jgi:hypothetical protein